MSFLRDLRFYTYIRDMKNSFSFIQIIRVRDLIFSEYDMGYKFKKIINYL